jgi:hypothetical protein
LSLLVPGGDVAVYWHVGVYAHQLVEVETSREKGRGREIDEDSWRWEGEKNVKMVCLQVCARGKCVAGRST